MRTGTQIITLISSDEVKMPAPATAMGVGVGEAAWITDPIKLTNVTGTPPE
jgi:hypothetical protein